MKWTPMVAVLAALFVGPLGALPRTGQDEELHRGWVDSLADESLVARDDATSRLLRAGRAAWPILERALAHDDPEVRSRAASILDSSRRRRQVSYEILREHPGAIATLEAGATREKILLIRTLARRFEKSADLLLPLLRDPEPEVVVASAEALYENRRFEWVEPLLSLLTHDSCPRATRVSELLRCASSSIPLDRFQSSLLSAGALGRARLVELAHAASLAVDVPRDLLEAMLRDAGIAAPRAALAWIRNHPPREDGPEIEPLLRSPYAELVAETLVTLQSHGRRIDPSTIRSLLSHEDETVRAQALELLASRDDPSAAEEAARLLADVSTSVRRTALGTLWKLRGTRALETTLALFFEEDGDPHEAAAAYLLRHREWTRPRLTETLAAQAPDRRRRASELLYTMDGVSVLVRAATDPDADVRRWALQRLLSHDGPSATETLQTLSKDPIEGIRFDALRGLVRRGARERIDELARFVGGAEYSFSLGAAETLFDYGGDRVPDLARQLLRIDDAHLRRLALAALSERRLWNAGAEALAFLADPDARLQRAAIQYLSSALDVRPDAKTVAAVRERLPALEGDPHAAALHLITTHGDASSRAVVREALLAGRAPSVDRALRALADWSEMDAETELAGMLGDDPALNHAVYRRMASLQKIGGEATDRALRRLMAHRAPAVRAGAIRAGADLKRDSLIPLLGAALDDSDAEVRDAAVAACGDLGVAESASRIARLLNDEDPDVRTQSARVLARLRPASREIVQRSAEAEDCGWVRRRMVALLAEWK